MNRLSSTRHAAFTLIELLVVIAIIAILAGLALSVASSARKKGDLVASMNNLRQWGAALAASMSDSDGFLPADGALNGAADIQNPDAWFNRLPRYIKEIALKDIPAADAPRPGKKSVWINPAVRSPDAQKFVQPPSSFLFCYAMNGYLSNRTEPMMKLTRVENHSATVFMGENGDARPVLIPESLKTYFGTEKVDTDPAGEANFLFCDGHVATLKRSDFSKPTATDDKTLDPSFTFIPYVGATR